MLFQLMCTVEDLKEMGIPLGPRKKIAKFVKERVNKLVRLPIPPAPVPYLKPQLKVSCFTTRFDGCHNDMACTAL